MPGKLEEWLKSLLGEVYQEMFPAPPTIEGRVPPVAAPPPQTPPPPPDPDVVTEPAERPVSRPRVERIERIEVMEPELLVEREIRRPRTEEIVERLERKPGLAPVVVAPPVRRRLPVGQMLSTQTALRQAILVQEILGPPKSLRDDRSP